MKFLAQITPICPLYKRSYCMLKPPLSLYAAKKINKTIQNFDVMCLLYTFHITMSHTT